MTIPNFPVVHPGGKVTPGMAWYVVYDVTSLGEATGRVISSTTEPKTTSDQPFVLGPYATQAQAIDALNGNRQQESSSPKFHGQATPISDVSGFIQTITNREFILRMVEVVLGGALVLVSIVKLTEGTKIESVGKAAAKVAPFLL